MPYTAYLLCGVEFAERASYYGCKQVFKNFIRGELPVGGNGAGAPPRGTQQSAGALGKHNHHLNLRDSPDTKQARELLLRLP